jgi:hypothetical protein
MQISANFVQFHLYMSAKTMHTNPLLPERLYLYA